MKARDHIRTAPYGPDTLAILYKAFDGAWDEIKSGVGTAPNVVEDARWKLATVILDLAHAGIIADADQLKAMALETFRALRP